MKDEGGQIVNDFNVVVTTDSSTEIPTITTIVTTTTNTNTTIEGNQNQPTLPPQATPTASDDTVSYVVGTSPVPLVVDGGPETTKDVLDITGTSGDEVFYLETVAAYNAHNAPSYNGPSEILLSNGSGTILVAMTEIEEIVVHGGGGNDTLIVSGDFSGTSLLPTTIVFDGGAGDDTFDLTGRPSNVGARGDGGDNNDTVRLDFAYSAITNIVAVPGGLRITHNGITDQFTNFESFVFNGPTPGVPNPISLADLLDDAPETNAGSGSGLEDATSIAVSLSGSDIDGTVASFHITSLPLNGTLYSDAGLSTKIAAGDSVPASGNAATVYFVPAANFNGQNTFQYAAVDNDGLEDATPATATITVTAVNDAPETNAGSGSGLEDAASIAVSLSGSDIDGTVASFHITSLPLNGTLYSDAGLSTEIAAGDSVPASGNAATVYFVPATNFNGQNTFQYAAVDNDGLEDATPATATITVTAVNDAPETNAGSGSGLEDAASIAVSLSGSDIDGTVASFHITSLPLNGTLYSDAGLSTEIAAGDSVPASGNAATVYFVQPPTSTARTPSNTLRSTTTVSRTPHPPPPPSPSPRSTTRRRPMPARAAGWRTRPRLRCRCRAPTSTARWRHSTSPACR